MPGHAIRRSGVRLAATVAALLLPIMLAAPAQAEDGRQEACVSGISAGSALNVRRGASPRAAVVGGIPASTCGVTILGACEAWCTVHHAPTDLRGLTARRFLKIVGPSANPNLTPSVDHGLFELRDVAGGDVFAVASLDPAGEPAQDREMTPVMTSGQRAPQGAVFVGEPGPTLQGGRYHELRQDGAPRGGEPPLGLLNGAAAGRAILFEMAAPLELELVHLRRDGDRDTVYRIARRGGVHDGGGGPGIPPAATFRPTRLPTPTPAPASGGWGPRFGGDKVTFWNHDGSGMAWESRGPRRWVWYWNVRDGLAPTVVTRGTLLFEGTIEGDRMVGRARTFSRGCGETPYPVTGIVAPDRERVVMRGARDRLDEACRTVGRARDTLSFLYMSTAPLDAEAGPDDTQEIDTANDVPASGIYRDRYRVVGVETALNIRIAPSASAAKVGELPAGHAGFFVNGCTPEVDDMAWEEMSIAQRDGVLASRWCEIDHRGANGFVSGRHLAVLPRS